MQCTHIQASCSSSSSAITVLVNHDYNTGNLICDQQAFAGMCLPSGCLAIGLIHHDIFILCSLYLDILPILWVWCQQINQIWQEVCPHFFWEPSEVWIGGRKTMQHFSWLQYTSIHGTYRKTVTFKVTVVRTSKPSCFKIMPVYKDDLQQTSPKKHVVIYYNKSL